VKSIEYAADELGERAAADGGAVAETDGGTATDAAGFDGYDVEVDGEFDCGVENCCGGPATDDDHGGDDT
jgi:carbon-monoxide dehydrogenase small subunit